MQAKASSFRNRSSHRGAGTGAQGVKKKKGGGEPPAPGLRKPGQRKAAGPRDSAPVLREKGWHPGGAIKRRKAPVPVGAVWWVRGEGHPCLQHFGAELRHQRSDLRGWSLEDLHQACGLCKSFLCDLENGVCTVTQDVIFLLEAGMTMADGGADETGAPPLAEQYRDGLAGRLVS